MTMNPSGGSLQPVDRPNPLKDAASKVGTAWSAASGVVSALVAYGVLNVAQGDAVTAAGESAQSTVTALGTVLAGVLPLITGLITAFRTSAAAKDHVTPVSDPRDNAGQPLTPGPAAAPAVGPTSSGPTTTDGDTWTG